MKTTRKVVGNNHEIKQWWAYLQEPAIALLPFSPSLVVIIVVASFLLVVCVVCGVCVVSSVPLLGLLLLLLLLLYSKRGLLVLITLLPATWISKAQVFEHSTSHYRLV
jgi:hypothetical protein